MVHKYKSIKMFSVQYCSTYFALQVKGQNKSTFLKKKDLIQWQPVLFLVQILPTQVC